jgi:multiple sugar transport system permease protein
MSRSDAVINQKGSARINPGKPDIRIKGNAGAMLNLKRTLCYVVLILIAIICIFPFYILIINATRAHFDIQKGFSILPGGSFVANYNGLMSHENLPVIRAMLNSVFISSCVAILTTYFSALTAFGIHAYNFKFKKTAYWFVILVMMIPTQVSTLGFLDLMRTFKLMDTYVPLIVPTIAAPVVFFFMKQYMEAALPLEIIEAARIDGSNEFRTFNRIVLPIMKPALAVQAIFSFVFSWNNYFVPTLVISSQEKFTIPIIIASLRSADYLRFNMGEVYVCIALAIVPVIIVYFILSKYIVRGVTLGSVKG